MKNFSLAEIETWERFYRANFMNSLTGFKSASLIGTANTAGATNLAIFSNIVHLGANPPLVGFVNRPREAAPHTISNIENTSCYTINHIHTSFVDKAHQTSAKYEANVSEFDAVGLTPEYIDNFKAPFVKESLVRYALTLEEIIPIKLNNTFFVIGKIISVHIDESIIAADGYLHVENVNSICTNGIDAYYETSLLNRFEYAKPNTISKIIK